MAARTILLSAFLLLAANAVEATAPAVPGPCAFPTRPGTYRAGAWTYTYAIEAPATRSEKRVGILLRDGREMIGQPGDVIETPLARFRWYAERYNVGWLNTSTYDEPTFPEDADFDAVLKGNARFACELYGRLRQQEGNLFFSPYSVSSALAMTYAGARGETAAEMAASLHFAPEQASFHPAFSTLLRRLNGHGLPQEHQLRVANALWARAGERFLGSFLNTTSAHYGAGLRRVDFTHDPEGARQTINRWVEDQTAGKIRNLLKPRHIKPATTLVLTNAVYFKGAWLRPFPAAATKPGDFHLAPGKTVTVPLMTQTGQFGYLDAGAFEMLDLPYEGGGAALTLLLPKTADGLGKMEEALMPERLAEWLRRLKTEAVVVTLPRFRTTSEFELKEALGDLGLKGAFTPAADFSGMTGAKGLFLSDVVHKAFVSVDEEGTEAAAATAVLVEKSGPPGPTVKFRADRPFVFLLRDTHTGTILFWGRLADPRSRE